MSFFGKNILTALAVMFVVVIVSSCEEELDTLGQGVVSGEPFTDGVEEFDVFAFNKFVEAVQTNRLPVYQLGTFDDPIYGTTEATITSQILLSTSNPTFGDFTAEEESQNGDSLQENEQVKKVVLYLPYQQSAVANLDSDGDGVDDAFDDDPASGTSNEDMDLFTDAEENALGTDPFDPSDPDSNGDGELSEEEAAAINNSNFAQRFALDSIFSNSVSNTSNPDFPNGTTFNLSVARSTFFLRDLDPDSNFQESQEFFSNQQFAPTFIGEVLADNVSVTIDDSQIIEFFEEDDPDTEVDETELIETRLNPGVRIELDPQFFQENLIDREGSSELLSQANFKEFIRGLHLSLSPTQGDLMILFDLNQANITVTYEFTNFTSSTIDGVTTNATEQVEEDFVLSFITTLDGNAVNTLNNDEYPTNVTSNLDTETNAERIFLKGGAGTFTEIQLFDDEDGSNIIEEIRARNLIINEANLIFYVDREFLNSVAPDGTIEPRRLYLFNTETNEPLYNLATEVNNISSPSRFGLFQNYDGILEEENGLGLRYTVRITDYINDIIVREETNAKLGLTLSSNIGITNVRSALGSPGNEFDLPVAAATNPLGTVLFGSNVSSANEDKKLKLQIFFTEPD